MVEKKDMPLLTDTLDLLNTACEASLELLRCFSVGEPETAQTLFRDLQSAIDSISSVCEPLLPQLEHSFVTEMLENIKDTFDDIERSLNENNSKRVLDKTEYQLFPFLRQLKESLYFWGSIYPDRAKIECYYRDEFAEHYKNFYIQDNTKARYLVSVLVLAYNHLEQTKECVQSVLENTDFEKLNAELVLIDHGSTDGTLEYFQSISFAKVIHLKKNCYTIGMVIGEKVCEGKYCAMVWNDTIVTSGWLDNLIKCVESDPKIISASAALPRISNLQALNVPDLPKEQFLEFARQNNNSNPLKWFDRSRICPQITIYNIENTNRIGLFDPLFYTLAYTDDDFSVRARRAGFRQILCEDVFCFHYGSLSSTEIIVGEQQVLVEGRKLFYLRYNFDPWGNGFCYDYVAVKLLLSEQNPCEDCNFLGIDCGMGDTSLQVRNELRQSGKKCKLFQINSQPDFAADVQSLSDEFTMCSAGVLHDIIRKKFNNIVFQYAFLSRPIEIYEKNREIICEVSHRLCKSGVFVCICGKPYRSAVESSLKKYFSAINALVSGTNYYYRCVK